MKTKATLLSIAIVGTLALWTSSAEAVSTTGNNFTFLDSAGNVVGGTNDVVMSWDGQFNTSVSDPVTAATEHMQLSSVYPFYGYHWTAHDISVFGPGTYTINVDCTTSQWETGSCMPNANPARNYTFTVGANQIAAHILWDWGGSYNMDIVNIWNQNAVFGPSPLYTGATGFNSASTVWGLMSTDANASCPGAVTVPTNQPINCGTDGINGIPMIDGPFNGFSANFNLQVVPIPAAFWLFGSGLIGLFGFARKAAR